MNPQYGKIATTPEEMAANRATLVAGSSGKLQDVGGNVIPASTLSGKETPFVISPPKTSGTAVGFGSELTSLSNAGVQEQDKTDALLAQQKADTLKTQGDTSTAKKSLLDYLGLRKGQTELTDTVYSTTNDLGTTVDETGKKLRNVNNQINAIDIGTNEQIKRITAQTGLSETQKNTEINNINRIASSSKADLYIDKLMAQGDYDSAKTIADRKVSMLMEQDKMEYDKLLFDYNENKDLFTKSEQRQFELMASNRKAEMDKKVADATSFEKTKIDLQKSMAEQKAPPAIQAAVAQIASDYNAGKLTASEAQSKMISAAGVYGANIQDKLIKDAQLKNLNSEIAKRNADTLKINAEAKALEIPPANENASQYAGAISTIIGSSKFTAAQKRDFVAAVNSGQDPFQVIKNQARNLLGTEKTDLLKFEAAKTSMETLDSELKAFYAAGGKSNIFAGNFEKVYNKLGAVNDPKLVGIATQIAASLQRYRNAISGTAYSEQEGKDIASIFPGITKGELLNNTIIKARLLTLNSDIDGMYRSVLDDTYDTLKASNTKTDNPFSQSLGNQGGSNIFSTSTGMFNIPN